MKIRTTLFVLAGLIIPTPLAAQTAALYEISLDQRIEKASAIVEGRVVSQSSFWDEQEHLIYTSNRVEVYRVFKGDRASDEIDIVTYGGVIGHRAQVVHPALQLAPGDVGVFFAAAPRAVSKTSTVDHSLQFSPYASVQGFARYDEAAGTASDVFHVYADIVEDLHARLVEKLGAPLLLRDYKPPEPQSLSAKTQQVPVITSFSPNPITAGNAAVLTINGTGFETYGGAGSNSVVFFPNADDGGGTLNGTPDSEVESWTDTRIEVRVPTRAGTGAFTVQTAGNSQGSSATALTVDYNLINVAFQGFKRTILEAKNNGGYSLMMSTNTSNQGVDFSTSTAVGPFERALATWQQTTGFNMRNDGGTTTSNVVAPNDDPDIVLFDNDSNPLGAGILGRAFSGFSSLTGQDWYVAGVDIQFRRDGTDNITWNFGPTATGFCCFDFETVALHELGHAHQLGHSISPGDAMHFQIANGTDVRTPNAVEIGGGNDVLDFSATKPNGMVRLNPVGIEDEQAPELDGLRLSAAYPNPARGEAVFSVEVERPKSITVEVFDVLGRRVMRLYDGLLAPGGATDFSVSSRELPPGVYLYTVRGESTVLTRSLVLMP